MLSCANVDWARVCNKISNGHIKYTRFPVHSLFNFHSEDGDSDDDEMKKAQSLSLLFAVAASATLALATRFSIVYEFICLRISFSLSVCCLFLLSAII